MLCDFFKVFILVVVHSVVDAGKVPIPDATLPTCILPSCPSEVYCRGSLLETVQLAEIYNDSKTFVDMRMLADEDTILKAFDQMMNKTGNKPTRDEIIQFVGEYFADGDELEPSVPSDWTESPKIFEKLRNNPDILEWARQLNVLWKNLTRKIKQDVYDHPDRYSLEPIPNAFVIPGGRFKETYYWDSNWIVNGLLLCEMTETARGMIENMLWLVEHHRFVPNGARVYYSQRSQPPLLTQMVRSYVDVTQNKTWLKSVIDKLEIELSFWQGRHNVDVNGHLLARYFAPSSGPRPESYREDYNTAAGRDQVYVELKSGAESGWDFTYRWIVDENNTNNGDLSSIATTDIIPVDLNAILCGAYQNMEYFYGLLGDEKGASRWAGHANLLKQAIQSVLWNDTAGTWFDYSVKNGKQRTIFYPSNVFPLWSKCIPTDNLSDYGTKAAMYLTKSGALNLPGGVPTSLDATGQQWDYPNAWAPLQRLLAQSLANSGSELAADIARDVSLKWVHSNFLGYQKTQEMYEKYNVEKPGENGGGGEYESQAGFGWTNGVILEMLNDYADYL